MAKSRSKQENQRWCFVMDDASHRYMIPLQERKRFKALLADEEFDRLNSDYDQYRIDGVDYSFTEPQRIQVYE